MLAKWKLVSVHFAYEFVLVYATAFSPHTSYIRYACVRTRNCVGLNCEHVFGLPSTTKNQPQTKFRWIPLSVRKQPKANVLNFANNYLHMEIFIFRSDGEEAAFVCVCDFTALLKQNSIKMTKWCVIIENMICFYFSMSLLFWMQRCKRNLSTENVFTFQCIIRQIHTQSHTFPSLWMPWIDGISSINNTIHRLFILLDWTDNAQNVSSYQHVKILFFFY